MSIQKYHTDVLSKFGIKPIFNARKEEEGGGGGNERRNAIKIISRSHLRH